MKKILLVGGNGQIGTCLQQVLSEEYEIVVGDIKSRRETDLLIDATDYEALQHSIPNDLDCLVILIAAKLDNDILNPNTFDDFVSTYLKTTYNLLLTAKNKKISKVVFTSSNHTTDYYEDAGYSLLGRPIEVWDYPYSRGLYGVLKYASEDIAHIFAKEYGLSIINLRIGTFQLEQENLLTNERGKRTWISVPDLADLFRKAIETNKSWGVYYGVSDNIDRPWNTDNAKEEIGYQPMLNTDQLMALLK